MNGLRETCHCGHDRASHYADPTTGEKHACLCRGCDCERYVNDRDPKPSLQARKTLPSPSYDSGPWFT